MSQTQKSPPVSRTKGPGLLVGGSLLLAAGLVLLLWSPWQGAGAGSETLVLYCAAGIKKPVQEIVDQYQEEYGVTVLVEQDSSGKLLAKLRVVQDRGDLYLAADDSWIEMAREDGRVKESLPVGRIRPVLVVSKAGAEKVRKLDDLLKDDVKVVLADPQAAVGKATRKLLSESGHWDKLIQQSQQFSAKVNFVGTVNEVALQLDDLQSADAGVVWDSIANQFDLQIVSCPQLEKAEQRITIGVLSSAKPTAALRFARYLTSRDKGQPIFARHGIATIKDADVWGDDGLRPVVNLMSGAMLRPGVENALKEFADREGIEINRVYNGCGVLVSQMKQGTHPDAYFSCDTSFMTQVQDLFEDPIVISENDMVLLVKTGVENIGSLSDLSRPGLKIGLGHPEKSALGALTDTLLTRTGHLQAIKDAGNLAVTSPTGDFLVNQIAIGALDATIVYRSNAMATAENLSKYEIVDIDEPDALAVQPFAIARQSGRKYLIARMLDKIKSAGTREQFESIGFRWKAGE